MRLLLLTILMTSFVYDSMGQTCCTAGAPISSSFSIQEGANNSFVFNLRYEYKSINLLIDEQNRLINDARSRSGQSATFKLDYILNTKWAYSISIPFVHQSRQTFSSSEKSLGLGDISLLAQYKLIHRDDFVFNLAGGLKIPTGFTQHRNEAKIFLSPDMQSGSGSFDGIAQFNVRKRNFIFPFFTSSLEALFRKNGTNASFGSSGNFSGRPFAFGDEFNSILSFQYQWITAVGFLIPELSFKYRWSNNNFEQNVEAPNSGGIWISVPAGFSFQPDDYKTIRLYAELPVYQKLAGLQISTNFTIGVQLRYILPPKSKQENQSL